MKLEQSHINEIRGKFSSMVFKEDLLDLLNYVKPFLYGEKAVPFELKQLSYYANPKVALGRYFEFSINKKSGGVRKIHAPNKGLKAIQKCLSVILQSVFTPHKAAFGFVQEKSIVDNARLHAGNFYVYNIDLKDFFPSIDQARVWKCLQLPPFNLVKEVSAERMVMAYKPGTYKPTIKLGKPVVKMSDKIFMQLLGTKSIEEAREKMLAIREKKVQNPEHGTQVAAGEQASAKPELVEQRSTRLDLANIISALCCTEMEVERLTADGTWQKVRKNVLPQGAPTSPVITNIICQRLDFLLSAVARRYGCRYSRYADDITFSSIHNIYQEGSEFITELKRVISDQGFSIKPEKTRLQKEGFRQEVTGLVVNEKVNVQRRYVKQLRKWLYLWETYGYGRAYPLFLNDYVGGKGHIKNGVVDMAKVIKGKLDYLQMVKGENNSLYGKLSKRFIQLNGFAGPENTSGNKESEIVVVDVASTLLKERVGQVSTQIAQDKNETKTNGAMSSSVNDYSDNADQSNSNLGTNHPIIHTPDRLVKILRLFGDNNTALKYATHSWEFGLGVRFIDFDDFLVQLRKEFNDFKVELEELNFRLYKKIFNFLIRDLSTGEKNYWGAHFVKFGWSNKELGEACSNDPSLIPKHFLLPTYAVKIVDGKILSTFSDVIELFKKEIEVRGETNQLKNIFRRLTSPMRGDFKIQIDESVSQRTFYTDVQWFEKGLNEIFDSIKGRTQHPNVKISAYDGVGNRTLIIEILHECSNCSNLSFNDPKLNMAGGSFSNIKSAFQNLCDWSVETEFKEGSYRINYLTSDENNHLFTPIETVSGFKHVLTFYR